jgi:hypothetical protein
VVAPFFDSNSGVRKSEYYKELIEHLKIVIMQASTTIPTEFCCSSIKGALDLDSYLESYFKQTNTEEPALVQEQIISLRKAPSVFNKQFLNKKTKTIEEQLELSNNLMSKCYTSINNLDIVTYTSEVSRRISLRKLYEFQQSYVYLKEWIGILANRQKGTKAASQVRALLLGKITIYQLLNIDQTKSNFFKIPITNKKNKKRKKTIESDKINIEIPGFSGKISARKLQTYSVAGPRLVQLLEVLNNNWVTLDLVDDITITWLENFKKDNWVAFIEYIKG